MQDFPHVAYALDHRLRFRGANAAWDQFAVANGARDDQLSTRILGRPFLDGVCEPARSHWQHILQDLLSGQCPQYYEEIPCDGPGTTRRIVVTATPTRDARGEIDGVLFVNYDVTAVRQREADEARLAGVLLLARTATHMLNNQLGLTVGYADMLATDPDLPEHLQAMAREALQGAEAAAATLQRLNQLVHLQVEDVGSPEGPIIDLDRATQGGEDHGTLIRNDLCTR